MKSTHFLLWLILPLGLSIPCQGQSLVNAERNTTQSAIFLDQTAMDTTVSPGENFFLYASGNWLKRTEIPASETGWGSFYTLYNNNQKNLRKILEDISSKQHIKGSIDQKVADLYASGMDTLTIEKLGYGPIKPLLVKIDAIKDYKGLLRVVAEEYKEGNGFLLSFGVGPDDKISTKNVVAFSQTGLGLPNRDYYFNKDTATQKIRKEYVKYITKLFTLVGVNPTKAAKQADDILALETAIAQSHSTPTELRDPIKNYNKYALVDFQKQIPNIDLKNLLEHSLVKTDTILVGQPKYYQTLNKLLVSQSIDIWKAKLKADVLRVNAHYLSKSFGDAHFDFYGKTMKGQKVKTERWKGMVSNVDNGLGDLLGQIYVGRYFKQEAKERMLTLVNNLQIVYQSRIEKLDWMSAETKQQGLAKLQAFIKKIGYPDKWEKYDDIAIDRTAYYKNMQAIARHQYQKMISKLDKPVDKTEWIMTPPTVNAYYNPSFNEIVFPAGILQLPFFSLEADDAVNYGAIGAVIGHEMTHGFDDQGRQYDKDGNLKDWWTKLDGDQFKEKAQIVVDQYNKYTVLNDLHVNGNLTLGENIADIGGLAIAYQAFKMTEQGKSDEKIDGFTPDQRFFLAFSQVWRIKLRDETARMRISTDPHSPAMYRVNGPLSNMDEFYRAFQIKPGDKMYRLEKDRVRIW